MSGCFGSSLEDRWIESQLFDYLEYLDEEDEIKCSKCGDPVEEYDPDAGCLQLCNDCNKNNE